MHIDTTPQLLRRLWSADLPAFRDHLLRLDPDTRHARFAMGAGDEFIARYAETGFDLASVIHGGFADGVLRGVGELRGVPGTGREAEAAFSVEREWRGLGFGSALMRRILLAARNRGIRRVYMNCLASNGAMQRLARRHGAELAREGGDVVALILPPRPSPVSWMREAFADQDGLARAVLHRWSAAGQRLPHGSGPHVLTSR